MWGKPSTNSQPTQDRDIKYLKNDVRPCVCQKIFVTLHAVRVQQTLIMNKSTTTYD